MTVFFAYFLFVGSRDFLATPTDLKTETGIIENISQNIDTLKQLVHKNIYTPCIDIKIKNKKYFIRLSDRNEYWPIIYSQDNIGKPIMAKFLPHFFQGTILYNPNQLSIDSKEIIPFAKDSKVYLGGLSLIFIMFISFGFLSFQSILRYRYEVLPIDRELRKTSIWKLIAAWLIPE